MTDIETETRLWTAAGFRVDDWRHEESAEVLSGNGRFILPLEVFLGLDEIIRTERSGRIGVSVLPGETLEPILPFLDTLPLIALSFPAFNDGRSYSKAQLLKGRYGFKGELRAMGDVLIDQIPHMLRCGFDTFEVSNKTALARLEVGKLGGIDLEYQPSVSGAQAVGCYSWRRVPA
ncbi:uncharacterized protein (DUF934 family) [Mesorhizobium sp. J18]|uniref:DUF934 domain-containing protein n=1 Tax=Mesorhizobium sp. J18 TaxID=935263 RepID=UPI00119C63D8|nr:DUF934 domain-containing protein [Mesorhizobium sp. J18]TWG91386.1 uncharacterized protein (DUF934 family) [Mesorhizobium sp. J18]